MKPEKSSTPFAIWCKLATLASLLLAGCAAQVPTIKTQIVKVPVPVQVPCPAPQVPPEPSYIEPQGTSAEIIRSLVLDFGLALGDSRALRAQLGARPPRPPASTPAAPAQ